jgi:Zn-dependent protease with chaperone function
MHTQGWIEKLVRLDWRPFVGAVLLLVTAALNVLLGYPRFVLALALVAVIEVKFSLGLGTNLIAAVALLGPVLYAALALRPTLRHRVERGRGWRWKAGGRRLIKREAELVESALDVLAEYRGKNIGGVTVHVADKALIWEKVRGHSVFLSRAALESDYLPAIVAHAKGHLDSWDGRLSEALHRLKLLSSLPRARVFFWFVGGAAAEFVMQPLWAWYWRAQEYRADAHAVSLGQGSPLIECLEDQVLPFEPCHRGLSRLLAEHPPTAYRIERIEDLLNGVEQRGFVRRFAHRLEKWGAKIHS